MNLKLSILLKSLIFLSPFLIAFSQNGWTLQNSQSGSWLTCVRIVDPDVAWAAGDSGTVIRTTNGGNSWIRVGEGTIGTTERLNIIDAIDSNTAFVVTPFYSSSVTSIYRTSDGGKSWKTVFSQNGGFIHGLRMLSPYKGIAYGDPVGGKWTILRTTDAGISWNRIDTEPIPDSLEVSSYYNSLNVIDTSDYIFSSNLNVYRTTDGGITWSSFTTPSNIIDMWLNKIGYGVATTTAYISYNAILTKDFGKTWTTNTTNTISEAVAGAGTNDFWVVGDYTGQGYGLFRSTNAGLSWNLEYTSYGQYLYALDFITVENRIYGFATGVFGAIVRYSGFVTPTSVSELPIPLNYTLFQNYPNPFNPITKIRFGITKRGKVTLTVSNILGQCVSTLLDQEKEQGQYEISFNGANLPSGVYYYKIITHDFIDSKKMLLLK